MRCPLGKKKLARWSRKFGMEFTWGCVRGNTGHRVHLFTGNNKEYQEYCWVPEEPSNLYRVNNQGDPWLTLFKEGCNEEGKPGDANAAGEVESRSGG